MDWPYQNFYSLSKKFAFSPFQTLGFLTSLFYLFCISLFPNSLNPLLMLLFSLFLIMTLSLWEFKSFLKHTGNIAITLFPLVWLTSPLALALSINFFSKADGRAWLTFAIIVTKLTDIGAYVVGKIVGRRLLLPSISPHKTKEGAIGGSIFAIIGGLFFSWLSPFIFEERVPNFHFLVIIVISLLISVLAQIGDFVGHRIKREARVKDSSTLPGYGGILDMLDSLVFTLPFVYFMMIVNVNLG